MAGASTMPAGGGHLRRPSSARRTVRTATRSRPPKARWNTSSPSATACTRPTTSAARIVSRSIIRRGSSRPRTPTSPSTRWPTPPESPCPPRRPCSISPGARTRSAGRPRGSGDLGMWKAGNLPMTLLCIATYRKGDEFLRECRRQGCRVLLLTEEKLRDADWPREAIDEFYYVRRDMPESDIRKGAAFLARSERIDRIVALDDFDVETAAMLREYLHVPGMGETTGRGFRDKLAMRARARAAGIPCPDFVHVVNHAAIEEWISRVQPPWVLKPRSQAAAIGIRKIGGAADLWQTLDALGDDRPEYLLEQFVPGDVYHV